MPITYRSPEDCYIAAGGYREKSVAPIHKDPFGHLVFLNGLRLLWRPTQPPNAAEGIMGESSGAAIK